MKNHDNKQRKTRGRGRRTTAVAVDAAVNGRVAKWLDRNGAREADGCRRTVREIAAGCGMSTRQVRRHLEVLTAAGLLTTEQATPGGLTVVRRMAPPQHQTVEEVGSE